MISLGLCMVLLMPVFIHAEDISSTSTSRIANPINNIYIRTSALDWVSDSVLNVIDSLIPNDQSTDGVEGRRKKRMKLNKYLLPLLVGFLLIKSILLPIALKTLAILSGKAVVLSLMSLILASIVGLRIVALNNQLSQYRSDNDIHLPLSKYRRKDDTDLKYTFEDEDPYKYYRERRRRK